MPKVTVAIPMRNAEPYIRTAIDSILCESQLDLELIVVDDRSTDQSRAIVASIDDSRIRLLDGPGTGVANVWNVAIEAARGEYFTGCDADDQSIAPRLARQAAWLDAHPDVLGLGGQYEFMSHDGRPTHLPALHREPINVTDQFQRSVGAMHHCTVMRRTETVRDVPYRSTFRQLSDLDHLVRLSFHGQLWMEPHVVYRYRMHTGSLSSEKPAARANWYYLLLKKCAEQRKASGTDPVDLGQAPEPPEPFTGPLRNIPRFVSDNLRLRSRILLDEHRPRDARRCLATAIRYEPKRTRLYREWIGTFFARPHSQNSGKS